MGTILETESSCSQDIANHIFCRFMGDFGRYSALVSVDSAFLGSPTPLAPPPACPPRPACPPPFFRERTIQPGDHRYIHACSDCASVPLGGESICHAHASTARIVSQVKQRHKLPGLTCPTTRTFPSSFGSNPPAQPPPGHRPSGHTQPRVTSSLRGTQH